MIDDLRTTIANANVKTPKGIFYGPSRSYSIRAYDQIHSAAEYADLVIAYKNGSPVPVRCRDREVDAAGNTKLGAG